MAVKYLMHDEGSFPLFLEGKDEALLDTVWYQDMVELARRCANVHIRVPADYTDFSDISKAFTDCVELDDDDIMPYTYFREHMPETVPGSIPTQIIEHCKEYNVNAIRELMIEWIRMSIDEMMEDVRPRLEVNPKEEWFVIGVYLTLIPGATMMCFKLMDKRAEKKCADDWCKKLGITVLDPDGWNRQDFDNSWAEEITEDEFIHRANHSTTILKRVQK